MAEIIPFFRPIVGVAAMLNFWAVMTGEGSTPAMPWPAFKTTLLLAATCAGLVVCAMPLARAEPSSYCVTCKNPDQSYVCRVHAGGLKAGDALKLYCIIRIAKEGHHASCAAESNSSTCQGVEKVYSYDGAIPSDIASDPRVKHYVNKMKRDQQT